MFVLLVFVVAALCATRALFCLAFALCRYGGIAEFDATGGIAKAVPPLHFANGNMDPLRFLAPNTSDAQRGYDVHNYVGGQNSFGYAAFASPADPPSVEQARDDVLAFMNLAIATAVSADDSLSLIHI